MSEPLLVKDALNRYAAASTRQFSDRSQTVGASEVGQCARKVFWIKNEGDPVYGALRDLRFEDGWGARVRGSIYENHFWEPALRARFGSQLKYAGAEQQTFVSGFLSATPDGLIADIPDNILSSAGIPSIDGDCIMVECKTADPRTNLSQPKPENVFQAQVQIGIVRASTPYRPTYSLLTYTDASFWSEVREFPIRYDEAIYQAAQDRAVKIMTATHAADLKPEGWIAGGKECEYCPFTKACGIERRKFDPVEGAVADPQFVAEIADLARAARQCEIAEQQNAERLREIQSEIRDRLRAKGLRKVSGDGFSVTWSPVKGRPSYDNKRLREAASAAGIDVESFSAVGDPTDRLNITVTDRDQASEQSRSAA